MKLESISPLTTNSSSALYLFHDKTALSKVSCSELRHFRLDEINNEEDFWEYLLKSCEYQEVNYNFFSRSELTKDCFGNGIWHRKELSLGDVRAVLRYHIPNYQDIIIILEILERHFIEERAWADTIQALISTGLFKKNSIKTPYYLMSGWDWDLKEETEESIKDCCIYSQYATQIWECQKEDVTPKHSIAISNCEVVNPNYQLIAGPIYKEGKGEILAYLIRECNGWNKELFEKIYCLDHFLEVNPEFNIMYGKLLPIDVAIGTHDYFYTPNSTSQVTYIYRDINSNVS